MFIVALTGGIGSGKSEASKMFSELGVPIVDLDVISHELTAEHQPLVNSIVATFGSEYMTKDGALNRVKMRQLIFNNHKALKQLNNILHPAIHQEAVHQLNKLDDAPYTILAIPLLEQDSVYLPAIDRILVVDCDESSQIERVKQRNHLGEPEIKRIIQAQPSRQTRLSMADDILENNGNLEDLRRKVSNFHQKYIKTCIVNKTIS